MQALVAPLLTALGIYLISGNVFQLGDWRILKTTPRMIKLIE